MTITKNSNRQKPQVAYVDVSLADLVGGYLTDHTGVGLADLTSTVAYVTPIALPTGSVIVSGSVTVEQAFNSTSTDVITVGDASTADRYVGSTSVRAAGTVIPFVPTGFITTASQPAINVTWTSGGGSPTTGRLRIAVTYYVVADVVEKTTLITYDQLTSGAAYTTGIALPVGSVVLDGSIAIAAAFNSGTSDVIVVGDVTTANRYVASTDIHTGATTPIPFVPTGFVNTATQSALKVTWTKVGASPSAGSLVVTVRYYIAQDAAVIDLPANAVVQSGGVTVLTAFNSGTSDTLVVGDTASATRYKTAFSIASTGRTELVPTGYINPDDSNNVTARWVRLGATAPTTGAYRLDVKYLTKGRSEFTQD